MTYNTRYRIRKNTPKISSETGIMLPDKTGCSKLAKQSQLNPTG